MIRKQFEAHMKCQQRLKDNRQSSNISFATKIQLNMRFRKQISRYIYNAKNTI